MSEQLCTYCRAFALDHFRAYHQETLGNEIEILFYFQNSFYFNNNKDFEIKIVTSSGKK